MDDEGPPVAPLVVCDVAGLTHPDVATVAALARLQLVVRRCSCRLALRNASPALQDLLTLTGLDDVLPAVPASPVQVVRKAEQPEQVRIEKEGEPADPLA